MLEPCKRFPLSAGFLFCMCADREGKWEMWKSYVLNNITLIIINVLLFHNWLRLSHTANLLLSTFPKRNSSTQHIFQGAHTKRRPFLYHRLCTCTLDESYSFPFSINDSPRRSSFTASEGQTTEAEGRQNGGIYC